MIGWLVNSWTLLAVAALGLFVVGRKRSWGWLVLVTVQCMWIVYGLTTREYGFVASGIGFAALNGHNYLTWRRADRETVDA